jgi:CheY-like chemotaxis protein
MDCNMPFKDGYVATKEIRYYLLRECGLDLKYQPLICAVTGHTEQLYVDKCFSSGMNNVFEKPLKLEILREVMANLEME